MLRNLVAAAKTVLGTALGMGGGERRRAARSSGGRRTLSRRLGVEEFENRVVPAHVWTAAVSDDWNVPGNWLNDATGMAATSAPNGGTVVQFNAASPSCRAPATALGVTPACGTLNAAAAWGGTLSVDNTTLTVYGYNGLTPANSAFSGGKIAASGGAGWLQIQKQELRFAGTDLGTAGVGASLFVDVGEGGTLALNGSGATVRATVSAGFHNGVSDTVGILKVLQSTTFTNTVKVTASSFMDVGNGVLGAPVVMTGTMISNYGRLTATDGCTIGAYVSCLSGAKFFVEGPATVTVAGSVYLNNAVLRMGAATGTYGKLSVEGNFTLNNSILSVRRVTA